MTVPGPFAGEDLDNAIRHYDRAIARAHSVDVKLGSTSVRVDGLLYRSPELAAILTHQGMLDAADKLIQGPFKLSAFHSRTIRPGAGAQKLHQDVEPGGDGWPLLGFILMLDAFTPRNGATRFLPDSQNLTELAPGSLESCVEYACGPAGTLLLFNGSTWHGHGANSSASRRRSVQGALVPRTAHELDHRRHFQAGTWDELPRDVRRLMED